jgi:thiol:disulfide interchange protein DsbC
MRFRIELRQLFGRRFYARAVRGAEHQPLHCSAIAGRLSDALCSVKQWDVSRTDKNLISQTQTLEHRMKQSLAQQIRQLLLAIALCAVFGVQAQEAAIRKNLAERYPKWAKIDEVKKTPVSGLYEVRIGDNLIYVDEQANYIFQGGGLIDTRTGLNLTEDRLSRALAIDFSSLPLKDAMVWRSGNGSRPIAVFVDPFCGPCRFLEVELQKLNDVTVYVFLYPSLGPASVKKSREIWCARDPARVWLKWMLGREQPPLTFMSCDSSALERNEGFGRRQRITGTPTIIFQDGYRMPGATSADRLERQLIASSSAMGKR